jgi:DNA ligase-1
MLFHEIAQASDDVASMSARLAKVARLADCLDRARAREISIAVSYLIGELPQGTIGVGWAALRELPAPADEPALELMEVDDALSRLQAISGPGSQAARRDELARLFEAATEVEQRFLSRLLVGELRQGALEGVMADAVARAAAIPVGDVRRAAMLAGDLPTVAEAALTHGRKGLAAFRLTPLLPVKPMLAQTADSVADALSRVGPALIEWKLDGARIQVHRLGPDVRIFTRSLADITDRAPEIVEVIGALPTNSLVLDGEVIALRTDGRPHSFQVTMSRFGTKVVVEDLVRTTPLSAFFFDCLHANGEDLIDRPARERLAVLDAHLPRPLVVPRIETDDEAAAQAFVEDALARGHEGVMVKALDAPYEAGRRGAGWLKVKPAHTLDLVVLAAEWGHGRRNGKLSNVHLGARDPVTGGFVMLGKTFKGMTDEMLDWQTEQFQRLETHRDRHTVHVRPELVVEVAFDGVQRSPRYPGGVALRFARVKGYRPDKTAEEADAIDAVRALLPGVES